jgi:hypothetical protein
VYSCHHQIWWSPCHSCVSDGLYTLYCFLQHPCQKPQYSPVAESYEPTAGTTAVLK